MTENLIEPVKIPVGPPALKLISLGGFGKVTSNMFVYEYEDDIVLVDCGMGFPTQEMLGVDILIPDISYLKDKLSKIRAIIITHGHEDHTGALPYILPQLPEIPVYASLLTANLIMEKLAEYQNMPKQIKVLTPGEVLQLGKFAVHSVRVSHSIPDATNLIIKTPVGTVVHAADFKFDFTPIDGKLPDIRSLARAGSEGVLLMLSDSLGSERKGYTPSERTLSETLDREMAGCKGKVIVTTMSSNISRWQQTIDAAIHNGRRVAISGRSIERNIEVAAKLGYIKFPKNVMVRLKDVKRQKPANICLLVAGSQAQDGSALERVANGEHRDITVRPGDKVIFSSDYIPGNESAVQTLIDSLSRLGAAVVYSELSDNLHVSGHGSQQDLLLMMNLIRPKFLLPIGGTFRHMVQYAHLAAETGYSPDTVLLPSFNQTIQVTPGQAMLGPIVEVKNVMVDGLGVGDVGSIVLRDRQHLAEEGVVVVVAEMDQNDLSNTVRLDLVSRGFVFSKENDQLFSDATQKLRQVLSAKKGKIESDRHLRQIIIDTLERYLFDRTHRRPMILPVVVEV